MASREKILSMVTFEKKFLVTVRHSIFIFTHLKHMSAISSVNNPVGIAGRRHQLLQERVAVVLDVAVEGVGEDLLGGDGALRGEPLDTAGHHVPARLG